MLAVSIDTIARLIEQGELGTVKIGRTLRVPRDDVQALVDRRRRVAASGRETGQ
jgi:excisionase family DNA binding protein